jgi:23S rRNA (adenine2503-C2)-methyltransferase
MTNLSKGLRVTLQDVAQIRLPEIRNDQLSEDGTRKWVMQLDEKNAVETVFIPETSRGTLCISSQVGCALDCSFCSTARQGFNRNLSVGEIMAQIWLAKKLLGETPTNRIVTNIVLMGMGEPLANYDAVVKAIRLMLDDNGFGLSRRKITLSTSGIVPAIYRLKEDLDVCLAVSLHATENSLRDQLVPINRKYPIEELLLACKAYVQDKARGKITFEYVMLQGVNDHPEHAKALAKLLKGVPSKINLIPFHPFPGTQYQTSSQDRIDRFHQILSDQGYTTILRRTRGQDIDAACGQLVGKVMDKSRRVALQ